jgi:hypothetical protein
MDGDVSVSWLTDDTVLYVGIFALTYRWQNMASEVDAEEVTAQYLQG